MPYVKLPTKKYVESQIYNTKIMTFSKSSNLKILV